MADSKKGKGFKEDELGTTGLKHFSGQVYEEFLLKLQGQKGRKIFQEMANNAPVISAMLFAVEALLRSVEWTVEPVSEEEDDAEAAEFLEGCLDDMENTWDDFISEVLSMLVFGWSYFEIVYKKRQGDKGKGSKFDDSKVGWHKFAIRAQETLYRWEIDERGKILGMHQYPQPGSPTDFPTQVVFIPSDKAMLFRTTSAKNNPEGKSVLRGAYRPWYYSKRIEEIEAIGLERDMAGMPIARVPIELLSESRNADQEQTYQYIKKIVQRVKQDEQMGIIWPKVLDENGNDLYDFDLLTTESRRAFDTGAIIQRYMQQQAMTIMADFILLGHESVGSFALSSDKTELFAVALGAWLDGIEETLQRFAVKPLFDVNDFDVEELPRLTHGDIEKPDLVSLGGYVQSLSGAGMQLFPDFDLENMLREAGDLPQIDPEDFQEGVMAQQQGFEMGGMPPEGEGVPPEMAPPDEERNPAAPALAVVKRSKLGRRPSIKKPTG